MLIPSTLLAVFPVGAIIRIAAQLGTAPALTTLILAALAMAILLIRILRPSRKTAATTLAAAAHWNLPVNRKIGTLQCCGLPAW